MTIISSNIGNNHFDSMRVLVKKDTESLLIVSPYLSENIASLLDKLPTGSLSKIELITTLKPNDAEQLSKPFKLQKFFEFCHQKSITPSLHINNLLHGKLYFALGKSCCRCLITSANFTQSGMHINHEWGVIVEDSKAVSNLLQQVKESIEYPDISAHQINKACLIAKQTAAEHPEWKQHPPSPQCDVLKYAYGAKPENHVAKYFLKPIGSTEEPILVSDREDFSKLHQNLHFSTKRPASIRCGDIVITTGVGSASVIGYFEITGTATQCLDQEQRREPWKKRWPWYIEGRNLSRKFSATWWEYNLRNKLLVEEFLTLNPNKLITKAGGKNLGTLNMGSDKVELTEEFGKYIVSRIDQTKIKGD